ncbi:MAG: hypothetical protein J7M19_03885 [Planctomycetes bacterium]|nr:hypothetical protein [Planctomycetota bacterium]
MAKAVALLSGGLDSQLAAKLVLVQGVEVEGLYFSSVFDSSTKNAQPSAAVEAAAGLGIPLETIDISAGQIEILKHPEHGFGSGANPCIDCHILMLRLGAARMHETGADFIVTGEVLGQRPMSQRRFALNLIDKEVEKAAGADVGGRVLRPLCAKALPVTVPEDEGLVDREKLEGITGRTRTRQIELASELSITHYPSPAGGCLLTDPSFAIRVKDLLAHGELDLNSARLLRVGRHYRPAPRTRVIVGRSQGENDIIEGLCLDGDLVMTLADLPGPTTLVRGGVSEEMTATAAALTARASKARTLALVRVQVRKAHHDGDACIIGVAPAGNDLAEKLSLNPQKGSGE